MYENTCNNSNKSYVGLIKFVVNYVRGIERIRNDKFITYFTLSAISTFFNRENPLYKRIRN